MLSRELRSSATPSTSSARTARGFFGDRFSAGGVEIGHDDVGAAFREQQRNLAADPARAADHDDDAAAEFPFGGIRWSLASSSAQYSMRKASDRGRAT